MKLKFSIIIPVYNRPKEIDELLQSLISQSYNSDFEVIIVEDGSDDTAELIIDKYRNQINISYYFKDNSGAGASRNYGMQRANGNYFLILDSDVILPNQYLFEVNKGLEKYYTDAFGGPDAAHDSFTSLQKAINYSMTSFLTTGGIRGKKEAVGKFQPRSFNLGISKKAFKLTNGFSKMKIGEDIDLTFRLWRKGFDTQLLDKAFVYHKRRSTLKQFFKQTYAFGSARPILNKKYPATKKITYWFPSLFIIGLIGSLLLFIFSYYQFFIFYIIYFIALFIDSLLENKSIKVAYLSVTSTLVQFLGYGIGFLKSFLNKLHN